MNAEVDSKAVCCHSASAALLAPGSARVQLASHAVTSRYRAPNVPAAPSMSFGRSKDSPSPELSAHTLDVASPEVHPWPVRMVTSESRQRASADLCLKSYVRI